MTQEEKDRSFYRDNFPTGPAREAADLAIDRLDLNLPMSMYIDRWISAYIAAGGSTPFKLRVK